MGRTFLDAATADLQLRRGGELVSGTARWLSSRMAAASRDRAAALLHPTELAHWQTLTVPRRATSYLLGRIAVKQAIAALGVTQPPASFEVASGVFRHPILSGLHADPPAISLTHCDAGALAVACDPGHVLGVDVEPLDPTRAHVFHSVTSLTERARLRADPNADRTANLLWSLKEALSKALRCGLTTPFEVLECTELQPEGPQRWTCHFTNFSQYRGTAWIAADHVVAVVIPKRTTLGLALDLALTVEPPAVADRSLTVTRSHHEANGTP
ncbi:MAG: 4'-phosphopantetheinyl transferase superfamily protein [Myxococcales bacterium]|nr:4'-phosphopantetheinyl transferase superfamily protein [Myxococcales bacterium]